MANFQYARNVESDTTGVEISLANLKEMNKMTITIDTKEIVALCARGFSAKDIGWHYLEQMPKKHAFTCWENAVDWQLGIICVKAAKFACQRKKHFRMPLTYSKGEFFTRTGRLA